MKARRPKPISKSMQKVHAEQIEEYIEWHRPRLRDYKVEVSPYAAPVPPLRFLRIDERQSCFAAPEIWFRSDTIYLSAERLAVTDALASALDLDMAKWFTPIAGDYVSKVSNTQILDALSEATGDIAPAGLSMKKADLASLAGRKIAGNGWFPAPLRAVTNASE